jgi:hypothetical protein
VRRYYLHRYGDGSARLDLKAEPTTAKTVTEITKEEARRMYEFGNLDVIESSIPPEFYS